MILWGSDKVIAQEMPLDQGHVENENHFLADDFKVFSISDLKHGSILTGVSVKMPLCGLVFTVSQ